MSVPNQCADDGALRRREGATASGSTVPSHGANTATTIMTTRIAPPTIAIGCRRNASRKRRHVGETDLMAEVPGSARTVATSVADARIEERVRKVHRQIHEHVDRRKQQRNALDDRIVAAK